MNEIDEIRVPNPRLRCLKKIIKDLNSTKLRTLEVENLTLKERTLIGERIIEIIKNYSKENDIDGIVKVINELLFIIFTFFRYYPPIGMSMYNLATGNTVNSLIENMLILNQYIKDDEEDLEEDLEDSNLHKNDPISKDNSVEVKITIKDREKN